MQSLRMAAVFLIPQHRDHRLRREFKNVFEFLFSEANGDKEICQKRQRHIMVVMGANRSLHRMLNIVYCLVTPLRQKGK